MSNKKKSFSPQFVPTGSDGRYLPRWAVANRVVYSLDGDGSKYEAKSLDISCMGACVQTESDLPLDRKVKMTIHLSDKSEVRVRGQIVWKQQQEGKCLAGVTFEDTSKRAQELILKHAFEIKQEDLVHHWFAGWGEKTKP